MRSRADIYRAKADLCTQTAATLNDLAEKNRWLELAQRWSKMAEQAKRDQPRDKRVIAVLRSHAIASGLTLTP